MDDDARNDDGDDERRTERRLAVTTNWAFFGSFGLAFILSGFRGGELLAGLAGYLLLGAAFGAHVIINHLYGTRFAKGEVALGFVAFAVSLASFALSWIAVPGFAGTNVAIGLIGFGLLLAVFLAYMLYHHGVRGSIDMIDEIRNG